MVCHLEPKPLLMLDGLCHLAGRVESIMVSAPPLIAWRYRAEPAPGSEEARLLDVLREPRTWARPRTVLPGACYGQM